MIILSNSQYRLEDERGTFFVAASVTLVCPICNGTFTIIGRRLRGVITPAAKKIKLMIRRLRCSGCGKIHHELPDYLVPYKRHCAETIESIITDNSESVPCETNVIRRIKTWWTAIVGYFTNILATVAAKLGTKPPERPTLKEIIRVVVNSHSWTFPGRLPGV